jgi:hypothetical protein
MSSAWVENLPDDQERARPDVGCGEANPSTKSEVCNFLPSQKQLSTEKDKTNKWF